MHRSLVDAACTVRCAIVLARTPCSSLRHDVLRRAVASYDVSPAGCSTGQPAHGPGHKLLRQHGVDGVPRSPDEKSMHFLSRFYNKIRARKAWGGRSKIPISQVRQLSHRGLERVNARADTHQSSVQEEETVGIKGEAEGALSRRRVLPFPHRLLMHPFRLLP